MQLWQELFMEKLNLILNHVGMNAKNPKHLSEPARYLLNNENHYVTWKILSLGHADFHRRKIAEDFYIA